MALDGTLAISEIRVGLDPQQMKSRLRGPCGADFNG